MTSPSLDVPTVDSWSDKDQKIVVSCKPGFQWNLTLRAKVDATPDEIYKILTVEDPEKVFRGIKAVTYRKVLEEDKIRGKKKLEVGHRSFIKFLFIQVTFETHLYVWEDAKNRTIHFQNAREGFMKCFDGQWTVQPFTQDTLNSIYRPDAGHKMLPNLGGLFNNVFGHPADASLVTLEQSIEPKNKPPAAISNMVTKMTAKQIQNLMEDLRKATKAQKEGTAKAGVNTPASAASLTAAMQSSIEDYVCPINIVIKL